MKSSNRKKIENQKKRFVQFCSIGNSGSFFNFYDFGG